MAIKNVDISFFITKMFFFTIEIYVKMYMYILTERM